MWAISLACASAIRASIWRRACFVKKSISFGSSSVWSELNVRLAGRTENYQEFISICPTQNCMNQGYTPWDVILTLFTWLTFLHRQRSWAVRIRLCWIVADCRRWFWQFRTRFTIGAGTVCFSGRFIHKTNLQIHAYRRLIWFESTGCSSQRKIKVNSPPCSLEWRLGFRPGLFAGIFAK